MYRALFILLILLTSLISILFFSEAKVLYNLTAVIFKISTIQDNGAGFSISDISAFASVAFLASVAFFASLVFLTSSLKRSF